MSFNAKNLSYDRSEPAFLRRLKGDLTAGRDTDRHDRPVARPKRLKTGDEDEDDGPTYVVEESNDTLTKAEYEALVNGTADQPSSAGATKDGATEKDDGSAESAGMAKQKQQQVASLGAASKKRKAVKIVGDADEDNEDATGEKGKRDEAQRKKEIKPKKPKKKAKAVKLSFGEDEEEKT